ncbi:hypothetical protein LJR030_002680 [Rhizobium sp. LjRoot30]|uniref:hypothetical protein n=1 Tax=Rhizobium sp. LjRoot30 TaxID=3342320 RepID=UPI003ECE179A
MGEWLERNFERIGAIGAMTTALAALVALIVIPLQIRSADIIQRDQTAREIYREFLSLTVQKPELASGHYCAMKDENQRIAYEGYVDYLFYTAEQMIESGPEWKGPMAAYFNDHLEFICQSANRERFTQSVAAIVAVLQSQCPKVESCAPQ